MSAALASLAQGRAAATLPPPFGIQGCKNLLICSPAKVWQSGGEANCLALAFLHSAFKAVMLAHLRVDKSRPTSLQNECGASKPCTRSRNCYTSSPIQDSRLQGLLICSSTKAWQSGVPINQHSNGQCHGTTLPSQLSSICGLREQHGCLRQCLHCVLQKVQALPRRRVPGVGPGFPRHLHSPQLRQVLPVWQAKRMIERDQCPRLGLDYQNIAQIAIRICEPHVGDSKTLGSLLVQRAAAVPVIIAVKSLGDEGLRRTFQGSVGNLDLHAQGRRNTGLGTAQSIRNPRSRLFQVALSFHEAHIVSVGLEHSKEFSAVLPHHPHFATLPLVRGAYEGHALCLSQGFK